MRKIKVCKWCGTSITSGFQNATAFCEKIDCKKKYRNHRQRIKRASTESLSSAMNNTMKKFEELFK